MVASPEPADGMPSGGAADDAALVTGLVEGHNGGLAALYDAYASRLYSYAASLLGDEHAAADVTHDTILIAADRIGQLRDSARLRPWLYSICRNGCLREFRRHRKTMSIDESPELAGRTASMVVDFDAELDAEASRELVSDAMDGMSEADREILDLALRHNLDYAELSKILGVGANNARARVGRCRASLATAIGSLLLFRGAPGRCVELDRLVDGQRFTPLVRKRISRHAESCSACAGSRGRALQAIATAALPLLVVPAFLRSRVVTDGDPSRVAAATWLENAPRFDANGWPITPGSGPSPAAAAVIGVAGAAVILAGLGIWITQGAYNPGTGTTNGEFTSVGDGGQGGPPRAAVVPNPSITTATPSPTKSSAKTSAKPTTATPTPSRAASSWNTVRATPTRSKSPSRKPTRSASPANPTSPAPATVAPSTSAPAPPPPPVDPGCLPWSSSNPGGYTTPTPPAGC